VSSSTSRTLGSAWTGSLAAWMRGRGHALTHLPWQVRGNVSRHAGIGRTGPIAYLWDPMASHAHTVLVVDDDTDLRDAISMLLTLHGILTRGARDGREALAMLQAGVRPCLILLDLHMEGMDGTAFVHAQQQERALRDIPVVVLSALPNLRTVVAPLRIAAAVEKPIDPARLVALVEDLCRTRPPRSQPRPRHGSARA